ncbi:hypothetical protein [Roseovarius salinarum]|uniref:hypothetical protein n=1 Tax=Roseovarius salinarum TaxID=1981892 RepID=UPI000C33B0F3|nr:hypothetical protein [Roseovarius salinarum]
MKVTHHTDDLLVVDNKPWLIAVILLGFLLVPVWGGIKVITETALTGFGIGMIVAGGLFMLPFFWGFVRRTQMVLDRQAGTVTIRRRTIFGYGQEEHALDDLRGAEVETDHGGSNRTHRMVLRFGDETKPFLKSYASGERAERLAELVNGWLGVSTEA